jgi:hypothetical protein
MGRIRPKSKALDETIILVTQNTFVSMLSRKAGGVLHPSTFRGEENVATTCFDQNTFV